MNPRYLLLFALLLLAAAPQFAQTFEYWPGTQYDRSIPTIESVIGHKAGDRISSHREVNAYFDALAAAKPNQIEVIEYGKTWEGRRLIYVVLGSRQNFAARNRIQSDIQKLVDPKAASAAEAKRLIANMPAIVWLAYSVHGNEISSSDAAMLTAYHVLAAQNEPTAEAIRDNVLLILDPLQNPDGRDRFVHHFQINEGMVPDASPLAAEHNEQWPGGRTNHYFFDLNRDWFALTQPETRGKVRAMLDWYPQVVVDIHEMGSNSTYYFAPEAVPFNPHLTGYQRTSLDWFGKNNAKWFDKFGFDYFTREVYDAFYPGYGASWPAYFGAIAMTYEQASSRGLVVNKDDGTTMHYRDTVRHHFTTSLGTAETAANYREQLLTNFYEYGTTALDEAAQEEVKAYAFPRRGNTSAVDKLAAVLSEQGIAVHQSADAAEICGQQMPAGSYAVSLSQRTKRYIRNMLDPDVEIDPEFMKEQERRRNKDLPDQIYDVTTWSLPLMWGVESVACKSDPVGSMAQVTPARIPPGSVIGGEASVAYLVPWGSQAATRFLTAALRQNLSVLSTDKAFTQGDRTYPRGTLIVKVLDNPGNLLATVTELARTSGANAYATSTGWVEDGVNFGSRNVVKVRPARIAMAWDSPTSSYSAGQTRFVLERQLGVPVTPIRTRQLGGADLTNFDVVILPDVRGSYTSEMGKRGLHALATWVRRGGTLIGIRGALAAMTDPDVGLLAVAQETLTGGADPNKDEDRKASVKGADLENEEAYRKAIKPKSESPDFVPGVLATAKLDPDHWVTAGAGKEIHALWQGSTIYAPISLDYGTNAAYFKGADELLASGYMWEENRKQLAYKPLVIVQRHGRGHVIGFTADPNFRAYTDGLNILFANAVFRGHAHSQPAAN